MKVLDFVQFGGRVETAGSSTRRGDPRSSAVFHPIGTHFAGEPE